MENLEIEKSLVISTGHISKETADLLELKKIDSLVVEPYEYGWRIHISTDYKYEEIPDDLKRLMSFADEVFSCSWIRLDQDGPYLDFFKTYDW